MCGNVLSNKTFWIGWVAVFAAMQAYGYLVHEIGMSGTYQALGSVFRPQAEMQSMMWMMMVGAVVSLLVFCYIYTIGYEGKGIMEGVRYGALMGLFVAIPTAVDAYVIYPVTSEVAVVWFVAGIAGLVIAGAIFASIYRPSSE